MKIRDFKRVFFVMFILIMTSIILSPLKCYAEGWGDKEVEPVEEPSTEDCGCDDSGSENEEETKEITVYVKNYIGIKGHVYDKGSIDTELGHIAPEEKLSNTEFPIINTGTDSEVVENYYEGVKGVEITVKDGNNEGTKVATLMTNNQGEYFFSQPGTYNFDFTIGRTNNVSKENDLKVSDVLTYNGHDYFVQEINTPNGVVSADTITKVEVINSRKGAAQVFLLIDGSDSMRYEGEINGNKPKRLEYTINAAKELVNSLLDQNKNIYIGIIAYGGEAFRAMGLTQNRAALLECLDELKNLSDEYWGSGTNIMKALQKADESFYTNEDLDPDHYQEYCNRNIILLSDGVPTRDIQGNKTYSNSTDVEKLNTLIKIATNTKDYILALQEKGINMYALFSADSDNAYGIFPSEKEFIETYIFNATKVSQNTVEIDNKGLSDNVAKFLILWLLEHGNAISDRNYKEREVKGLEDEVRSNIVKKNFDFFFNDIDTNQSQDQDHLSYHTVLFKEIYNDSYVVSKDAKKLGEGTYMLVHTGPYILGESGQHADYDEVDGKTITHYKYVDAYYEDQNIYLQRKEQFILIPEITATALRVTLNTGTVLGEMKRADFGSDKIMLEVMDNEIAQGAQIAIEYEVHIKNESSRKCTYLDVVDYIPKGFVYKPYESLITEPNKKNNDYHWTVVELDNLIKKNYVTVPDENDEELYRIFIQKYAGAEQTLRLTRFNNRELNSKKLKTDGYEKTFGEKDRFYLDPGEEYVAKYVVTRIIGTVDDLPDIYNDVEILGYGNTGNRRMAREVNKSAVLSEARVTGDDSITEKFTRLSGRYPGTFLGEDFANTSNLVAVIPPTGGDAMTESKNQVSMAIYKSIKILAVFITTAYILKQE